MGDAYPGPAYPGTISYNAGDLDLAARTIIGEAAGQPREGQVGVAHVIANRVRAGGYGDGVEGVVLAPDQFEPWGSRRAELLAISPKSQAYGDAYRLARSVFDGIEPDPTEGATHFANVGTVQRRGDSAGQPGGWLSTMTNRRKIGDHTFGNANAGRTTMAGTKPQADETDDDMIRLLTGGRGLAPEATTTAPAAGSTATPANALRVTVRPGEKEPELSDEEMARLLMSGAEVGNQKQDRPPLDTGGLPAAPFAAASGFLNGFPVVGPTARKWLGEAPGALANSYLHGTSFDDELKAADQRVRQLEEEHPYATMGGNLAGTVAGYVALSRVPGGGQALGMTGSIPGRMLKGGLGNALLGAADSYARSGEQPTYFGQIASGLSNKLGANFTPGQADAVAGGTIGLLAGGAAPALGAAVGAGAKWIGNKLTGPIGEAGQRINRLLDAAGLTPSTAATRVGEIGPNAVLADAHPTIANTAAELAGQNRGTIAGDMANRAGQADTRTHDAFERFFGPKMNQADTVAAVEAQADKAAAPHYRAAYGAGHDHDVSPIANFIDGKLQTAVGDTAKTMREVKGYLTDSAGKLKTGTDALHAIREEVDGINQRLIAAGETGTPRQRALQAVRGKLDAELKQNPHMAAGDAAYAEQMRIKDAIGEGAQIFDRNVKPDDVFKRVMTGSADEVAGYMKGVRVALADKLEAASRGELAGAQNLLGKNTANRAKLVALHGKNGADALEMLANEATLRGSEKVVQRGAEAGSQAFAQNLVSPAGAPSAGMSDALAALTARAAGDPSGLAGVAAKRGLSAAWDAHKAARETAVGNELARVVGMGGPNLRNKLLDLATANENVARRSAQSDRVTNLLTQAGATEFRRRYGNER